jgi:hypothetical protein
LLGRCRHGLTPVAGEENCGLSAAIISTSGNNTKKKYSSILNGQGSNHRLVDRGKPVPPETCGYKETGCRGGCATWQGYPADAAALRRISGDGLRKILANRKSLGILVWYRYTLGDLRPNGEVLLLSA